MDGSSPAFIIYGKLEGVEIILETEMDNFRHIIAPSQKIDSVTAGNLIDVGHYKKIVVSNSGDSDKLIKGYPLIRLLDERILISDESTTDHPVCQSRLGELKVLTAIFREEQRFGLSGESGVGLKKNELGDVWA